MNHEAFEKLVMESFNEIPQRFRKKVDNVALIVEDDVSEEDRRRKNLTEGKLLLGLYVGIPNSERGSYYGVGETLPDTIKIYRLPCLEYARSTGENIDDVVRHTVWHEFAHFFGMDESMVRKWEKEKQKKGK